MIKKLGQNQISELKETKKMKVVRLNEQKPNNSCRQAQAIYSIPFLTKHKNSPLEPKNVKNYPKIKSKSNVRTEGNIENESCSTT